MINVNNGHITIKGKNYIIRPNQSMQEFEKSDLYRDVLNKQVSIYPNYYIKPQMIGDKNFIITIFFNKQKKINLVNLGLLNSKEIPSWESWSEQKELKRKEEHDKWLEVNFGKPPYRYEWGEIISNYDPRVGSSMITIRYYKKKE